MRTVVELDVHDDGSGTVAVAATFDREAIERLGGADGIERAVRVDDLEAGGWDVTGPLPTAGGVGGEADGSLTIRAEKAFARLGDIDAVIDEIAGPEGPFRDFSVARHDQLARSRWSFAGTVDLSGGLEAFGDAGLAELLGGEPLGEDVAAVAARIGGSLDDAFPVEVAVRLPGELSSNALEHRSGRAIWRPSLAEAAREALVADGRQWRLTTVVFGGVGVAAVVALLVVLGFRAGGRLVRRKPRGRHVRSRARTQCPDAGR